MIDASQFKTTTALDSFSLRAANDMKSFVADEVATPMYVSKAQYAKYQYDMSNFRRTNTKADSKATAMKIDYGVYKSTGQAELYKQAIDIDPQDERDADAAVSDMEQDAALAVLERLLIDKEAITMTKLTTAANFPSSLKVTLAAGSRWSSVGGDPVADIATGQAAIKGITGQFANSLLIGWQAFAALRQSAALRDQVKYTSGDSLSEDQIKGLLGVKEIIISGAQYNTNNEGSATQSLSNILGNFALLFVKNPDQTRRTTSFARTVYVTGSGGSNTSAPNGSPGGGFYTWKYQDNERGGPAGRIQVLEMGMEYAIDLSMLDSQASAKSGAGYLITTPI